MSLFLITFCFSIVYIVFLQCLFPCTHMHIVKVKHLFICLKKKKNSDMLIYCILEMENTRPTCAASLCKYIFMNSATKMYYKSSKNRLLKLKFVIKGYFHHFFGLF